MVLFVAPIIRLAGWDAVIPGVTVAMTLSPDSNLYSLYSKDR